MKTRFWTLLLAATGVLSVAVPLVAHHSFAAEYDSSKPISVKGTVRKLAWVNPHAYVYVDVKESEGKIVTWAFETLSPNALARQGWNRDSLKYGDPVSVEGYLARDTRPLPDGSLHANARVITRTDGRKVFSGPADDGGPSK
jgi:hypothetical protein